MSTLTTSSIAASSVGKSLDKVAVGLTNVPARSPIAKMGASGQECNEQASDGLARSFKNFFKNDDLLTSAEKAHCSIVL